VTCALYQRAGLDVKARLFILRRLNMNTQSLEWVSTGTFSVSMIAHKGDRVVKAVPMNRPLAIGNISFGTELLEEARLPVLPILREYKDADYWYHEQEAVEVGFEWTKERISEALELVYSAFEVGVGDLYPDNFGLKDGELVILDAGGVTTGDQMFDGDLFYQCLDAWYRLEEELIQ
jgi:hypothetical protein